MGLTYILWVCIQALSCVRLFCDSMDYSPPGSSIHRILQERILEWVAISFSRGSSLHRDKICITYIAGRFFTTEPPGKPNTHTFISSTERANDSCINRQLESRSYFVCVVPMLCKMWDLSSLTRVLVPQPMIKPVPSA